MAVTSFIPALLCPSIASMAELLQQLAVVLGQPALRVDVRVGLQSGGARAVTLSVLNGRGEPCGGVYELLVWISASEGGAPGGTQTVTVTGGTLAHSYSANQLVSILTASDGTATFTLTAAAGQSRAVHAVVRGVAHGSDLFSFA